MQILAVTSGKGGVGKSTLTANLGICLAKTGRRVLLMDCDFGLANLDVVMGVRATKNLQHVVAGEVAMPDALTPAPGNTFLLAGGSGVLDLVNLDYNKLRAMGAGFDELSKRFDYVLLDTAAGVAEGVLSMLAAADEVLLVMTFDPSSVLDAYATIKLLLERKPDAVIRLIINSAPSQEEGRALYARFATVLKLQSEAKVSYLGTVRRDEAVSEATRARSPFVLKEGGSAATDDLHAIASLIAQTPINPAPKANFFTRMFRSLGR